MKVNIESEYPSFTFYGSYTEQVMRIMNRDGEEAAKEYVWKMVSYVAGLGPEFTDDEMIYFCAAKPNIDKSVSRYYAGKNGGRKS